MKIRGSFNRTFVLAIWGAAAALVLHAGAREAAQQPSGGVRPR